LRKVTSFYTKETQGRILPVFPAILLKNAGKGKTFWSEKLIFYNTADSEIFPVNTSLKKMGVDYV